MSQSVKIDFVALTSLRPADGVGGSGEANRENQDGPNARAFRRPGFRLRQATRNLIGAEGEALIKRAAGAAKFKGKGSTALDIIAPAGFVADRLLVIGTGPADEEAAKSGKGKDHERAPSPTII